MNIFTGADIAHDPLTLPTEFVTLLDYQDNVNKRDRIIVDLRAFLIARTTLLAAVSEGEVIPMVPHTTEEYNSVCVRLPRTLLEEIANIPPLKVPLGIGQHVAQKQTIARALKALGEELAADGFKLVVPPGIGVVPS